MISHESNLDFNPNCYYLVIYGMVIKNLRQKEREKKEEKRQNNQIEDGMKNGQCSLFLEHFVIVSH